MDKEKQIASWYDDWHEKHGIDAWRPIPVYECFLQFLGDNPWGKLLDVGFGTGGFLLAAQNAGLQTFGLDVSVKAADIASKTSPNSMIATGSMETIGEQSVYRYITAIGSFEHCPDLDKAIKSITGALMIGGKFIVMVPSSEYAGAKMSVQDEIQETRKTLNEWLNLLQSTGLVARQITHDPMMPTPSKLEETYQFVFVLEKI